LSEPELRTDAERVLSGVLGVAVYLEPDPAALSATVSDPERVARALSELSRADVPVAEFALGQPSLDEVFLALTGRPVEEAEEEEDAA
jgi:ABC-2 type transport system ATP-binding protein